MKNSAALKESDLKVSTINLYDDEMAKISDDQRRMKDEMDEMESIIENID